LLLQTRVFIPHCWLAQHGWPAPPHIVHVWLLLQPSPWPHVSFAQHGWPAPPHMPHVLSLPQPSPWLHALFAQHGWPAPPHWAQTWFAQPSPWPHWSPGQHAWPAPPHATQLLFAQRVDGAVQLPLPPPPWQHGWLRPPQLPQLPLAHAIWFGQLLIAVTQLRPLFPWTQQPPPPHVPRSQHGCPAPPHAAHTLAPPPPVHTAFAVHWRPGQQS
jgi:hypothetical protein